MTAGGKFRWSAALLLLALTGAAYGQWPLGTAFTYQGQLTHGGVPIDGDDAADVQFTLWDAESEGNQLGSVNTFDVDFDRGRFTALLDFGAGVFTGQARWLEIAVRAPAGGGLYTTLTPRQELTPAPYALALPGLRTVQHATSPNLIGGNPTNQLWAGVYGATISGGGAQAYPHSVSDNYGTVGGGLRNFAGDSAGTADDAICATVAGGNLNAAGGMMATVSGGQDNGAWGNFTTVGGGASNHVEEPYATVGGGWHNRAEALAATVAGGSDNTSGGLYATIGGGAANSAAGQYAVVPGGRACAAGDYGFAAGRRAHANYSGTFVWADATDEDFSSTCPNEFAVRATGGMRFVVDTAASGGALRFVPATAADIYGNRTPNLIGGFSGNGVTPGVVGATLAGGGASVIYGTPSPNSVTDHFGTVGGGALNRAGDGDGNASNGNFATVAGGQGNTASKWYATIGGGLENSASGYYSTVGGGVDNIALTDNATIAGGTANTAVLGAAVGGGSNNAASGILTTISGGTGNVASAEGATVSGGHYHDATGAYSSVGGGWGNQALAWASAIGGGMNNEATGEWSTIGGGEASAASGDYSTVGGGYLNEATGEFSVIGGGLDNEALGHRSTIAGGEFNRTTGGEGVWYGTVGGGTNNEAGAAATVAGGYLNHATGEYSSVAGGYSNTATAYSTTVGGGEDNDATGDYSTVGGGVGNYAGGATSTVGGGWYNEVSGPAGTVAGGQLNDATAYSSTVGGGEDNDATGDCSTVPGGIGNQAGGYYSFAAGLGAKVRNAAQVGGGDYDGDEGTFMWADSTGGGFTSTGPDQFLIRATGGVGIGTTTPAHQLDVNGTIRAAGTGATGATLIIHDSNGSNDRPGIQFTNNSIHFIAGDDLSNEFFGFYSAYSNNRTNDAMVRVHGKATGNWGKYIELTHDGTDGKINTDSGHLLLSPGSGNVGIGISDPTAKLHIGGTPGTDGLKFPDGTLQTTAASGTVLSHAVSVDPPSLASGAATSITVTVTGAATGDAVVANPGANLPDGYGITFARVSAANTITIGFINGNASSQNPAATTWAIRIIK